MWTLRNLILFVTLIATHLSLANTAQGQANLSKKIENFQTTQEKNTCIKSSDLKDCSDFAQKLSEDDQKNTLILKSDAQKCFQKFNKAPMNYNPEILNHYQNKLFNEMGGYIHSQIQLCSNQNSNLSNKNEYLSKSYYHLSRIQKGQLSVLNEIAEIDNIIGDPKSNMFLGLGELCEQSPFQNVVQRCELLQKKCNPTNSIDPIVESTQTALKNIQDIESKLKTLRQQRFLKSSRWGYDQNTPDQKNLDSEIAKYENLIEVQKNSHPWIRGEEFQKSYKQDLKKAITDQLKSNKKALIRKYENIHDMSLCFMYSEKNCEIEKYRLELDQLPSFTELENSPFNSLLNSESCVQDSKVKDIKSADAILDLGGTILLTGASFAVSGPIGASAALSYRAARVASLMSRGTAITTDAAWLGLGAQEAYKACTEKAKLVSNKDRTAGSNNSCPQYGYINASQLIRDHDNCLVSAALAATDAIPIAAAGKKLISPIEKRTANPSKLTTISDKNRLDFENEHLNSTFDLAGPTENREFMRSMDKLPPNSLVLDTEHSALQKMNTVLPKNLNTAITNYHKKLMKTKLDQLKKKYPNMKIYSDFKSGRVIFEGADSPALKADIDQLEKEVNSEFATYLTTHNIVRESDKPEEWFKFGTGTNPEQANQNARTAREMGSGHGVIHNDNPKAQLIQQKNFDQAEKLRAEMQKSALGKSALMKPVARNSTKKVPKAEVLDILKKNPDNQFAILALKAKFPKENIDYNEEMINQMRDYVQSVKSYEAALFIEQRVQSNLDLAEYGGATADLAGMGAQNAEATARALALANNPQEAMKLSREAEKEVTRKFNFKKFAVKEKYYSAFGGDIDTVCSGDDCRVLFLRGPATPEQMEKYMKVYSQSGKPAGSREVFVHAGVKNKADRTQLSVDGENIEKAWRKNKELLKSVPTEKLSRIGLVIDMKTTEIGQGAVNYMLAVPHNVKLTESEMLSLEKTFREAVQAANESNRLNQRTTNYKPAHNN